METFLLYANAVKTDDAVLLRNASRVTRRMMPSLGLEMETHERVIPEINGGWFYLAPRRCKAALITEYADSRQAVIVFGELYGNGTKSAAEKVIEKWRAKGPDGVRLMDGCFSALVVDLETATVHMFSDLLGHRSLRFFSDDRGFIASPHDIPIVSTGCCPAEIDSVSAASILAFDWSLEGRSLLREISAHHPNELISWRAGTVTRHCKPMLNPEGTLDERDHGALKRHLEMMKRHMIENVWSYRNGEAAIKMDLTAGLDSRAVLAVLLKAVGAERVKAYTAGEKESRDVKAARELSRRYKFSHGYGLPETADYDTFYQYCRLRAFLMNGDTNAKRATTPLPSYDETPNLHGGGGEIYRGYYYYPDLYRKYSKGNPDDRQVLAILEKKYRRLQTLPWLSDDLQGNIGERLEKIINSYSAVSRCGWDKLDLFYIYERYGRWGALVPRSTWEPRRFSPFCSPTLLCAGFRLPRPIASGLKLHKTLIKDAMPLAYYFLPVNETDFIPLEGHTSLQTLFSKFASKGVKGFNRTKRSDHRVAGHEAERAVIFRHFLTGGLRDLLLEENGIGTRILRKKELIKIIETHISGESNHLQVLGFLAVMEVYRHLVEETLELAKCCCA
jgi:hypothetical protein